MLRHFPSHEQPVVPTFISMNSHCFSAHANRRQITGVRLASLLLSAALLLSTTAVAQFSDVAMVNYTPPGKEIPISPADLPYRETYALTITAPPAGANVSFPIEVTLVTQLASPSAKPATVTEATALSYVSVTGSALVGGKLLFNAPNEAKTLSVTVSFPPATVAGFYGYTIVTTGWPGANYKAGTGGNLGSYINASVSAQSSRLPPVVDIVTPVNAAVVAFPTPQPTYAVPLAFEAIVPPALNTASEPVVSARAEISTSSTGGGVNIPLTSLGLNTVRVSSTGTMVVPAAGTYYVTVTATSSAGSVSDTHVFTVVVDPNAVTLQTVRGAVFLDLNNLGVRDPNEVGLGGITVRLYQGPALVRSVVTAADGKYTFIDVPSDTYDIDVVEPAGLTPTDALPRSVSSSLGWNVSPDLGLTLDFAALRGLKAGGFSHGYWKNNVDKAIAGKTNGAQVSAATIAAYTTAIGTLALSPFDGLTWQGASDVLSSNSNKPVDLLRKQLLASEYNYANGANGGFINGSAALTYAFVLWGEYVVVNAASLPSSYVLWAKDWFDAYNNSHGGAVNGPAPR